MSMFLLRSITDAAQKSFGPLHEGDADDWVQHWFDTAEMMRLEAMEEGLKATAAEIDRIAEQQARFSGRPYTAQKAEA